jgi:predicted DNA binding CopG/RHH family protein
MRKAGKYAGSGNIKLTSEESKLFDKKIAEADAEIEAARVNFRWDKQHVDIIKAAAGTIGVPYQIYIKMVIFEHAVKVLRDCKLSNLDEIEKAAKISTQV